MKQHLIDFLDNSIVVATDLLVISGSRKSVHIVFGIGTFDSKTQDHALVKVQTCSRDLLPRIASCSMSNVLPNNLNALKNKLFSSAVHVPCNRLSPSRFWFRFLFLQLSRFALPAAPLAVCATLPKLICDARAFNNTAP